MLETYIMLLRSVGGRLAFICSFVAPLMLGPAWGQAIQTIAGGGPADGTPATEIAIDHPEHIACGPNGNCYVCSSSGVIYRIDGAGKAYVFAGPGARATPGPASSVRILAPSGLTADLQNNVYVGDRRVHRVYKIDPAGNLSIFAGGPHPLQDGGPATSSGLVAGSMTSDAAGNVYVAGGGRVRKITPGGIITTIAGLGLSGFSGDGGLATAAAFSEPGGLSADAAGNLYIADTWNNRIRRVSASGIITTIAGTGSAVRSGDGGPAAAAGIPSPSSVHAAANGEILVGTPGAIRKIDANGIITTLAVVTTTGMTVAGNGDILLLDNAANLVRKMSSGGAVPGVFAGNGRHVSYTEDAAATNAQIGTTSGMAVDAFGNVYIVPYLEEVVLRINPSGLIRTYAGRGRNPRNLSTGDGGPATAADLYGASGVAADTAGNVYVAEYGLIRKVSTAGIISRLAGTGLPGFSGDGGPALSAQIDPAGSMAFDPAGNLYFLDRAFNSRRVRRIDGSGRISTVAGLGISTIFPPPAVTASLHWITSIAFDSRGVLYLTESYPDRGGHLWKVDVVAGTASLLAGGTYNTSMRDGEGLLTARLENLVWAAAAPEGDLFLVSAGNVRRISQPGLVWTFAGVSEPGFSGDGGPAGAASLYNPGTIAIDPSGTLYIADVGNQRIRRVALPKFPVVTGVSPSTATAGSSSLTITLQGRNFTPQPVVRWNGSDRPANFISTTEVRLTLSAAELSQARAVGLSVFIAGAGESNAVPFLVRSAPPPTAPTRPSSPYPADGATAVAAGGIFRWQSSGATSYDVYFGHGPAPERTGSPTTANQFQMPYLEPGATYTWRVVAKNGAAETSSPVWRFTAAGIRPGLPRIVTLAGRPYTSAPAARGIPNGAGFFRIACSPAGNCYVSSGSQIFRISSTGTVSHFAGTGGSGTSGDNGEAIHATFASIDDLAVNAQEEVFVAQAFDFRVRKIDTSGIIKTVAGTGVQGNGLAEGVPAANHPMPTAPCGIAVDRAGSLYIADGQRIRRVDPSGIVYTIAGLNITGRLEATGDDGPAILATTKACQLAMDSTGNLFLADYGSIRKIGADGIISVVKRDGAGEIAVDSQDRLLTGGFTAISRVTASGSERIAGTWEDGDSGDGGPATSAQMFFYSMAATPDGAIWIAGPRIRRIDANGVISGVLHSTPFDEQSFGSYWVYSNIVASDKQGNTFAVSSSRIWKISQSGQATVFAGGGSCSGDCEGIAATEAKINPAAMAVDAAGLVYFAEEGYQGGRLRKIDGAGKIRRISDGLQRPAGMAVDAGGNVYVSEYHRVIRFAAAGARSTVAGGDLYGSSGDGGLAANARLTWPSGLALDTSGNLYIADTANRRVRRVDTRGIITTFAGTAGAGGFLANNLYPTGVAVDGAGAVYVTDSASHLVFRFTSQIGYNVTGNGEPGFSGDGGPALYAHVNTPTGIAVDGKGNVVFADSGNGRIRKLLFSPAIEGLLPPSVIAGSGAFTLEVRGGEFPPDSVVMWGNTALPTTFVNSTTLRVPIPATNTAAPANVTVSVSMRDVGMSNGAAFYVLARGNAPAVPGTPSPGDGSITVAGTNVTLTWTTDVANSYSVYFGTSPQPPLVADPIYTKSYNAGTLTPGVRYYWRVVATNSIGSTSSPTWSFTAGGGSSSISGGLRFVAVTPCRIADTRNGQGTLGDFGPPTLLGGNVRELRIPAGPCGIPAAARAYSLNVTVVPHEPLGFLTLWPAGQAQPVVSTLNSFHGGVVANSAIVPAGANGAISAYVTNRTDLIVDINGYFEEAAGLDFYALQPCRLADTRPNSGFSGAFGSPTPAAKSTRSYSPSAGGCGVPSGAQAYVMNITAVPHGALGYLTSWPAGQTQPFVSTLNSFDGAVVANGAIVKAGAGGAMNVYVTDSSDTILDMNGYFGTSSADGLRFYPLSPCRVADTRPTSERLNGGEKRTFIVGGRCSVPTTAKALALNVTAVPAGPLGYLSLWPTGSVQPLVSTLNSFLGRVVANGAIATVGINGSVDVFASNETHVILDVTGYFE